MEVVDSLLSSLVSAARHHAVLGPREGKDRCAGMYLFLDAEARRWYLAQFSSQHFAGRQKHHPVSSMSED